MKDWKKVLVSPDSSIRNTIQTLENCALQIALVADENRRLLGTVTDGDVRRAILEGIPLDDPVRRIMNPHPTTVRFNEHRDRIIDIMKNKCLNQIPILDDDNRIVGIELVGDMIRSIKKKNPVVLMAGGLGSRLFPLTNDCPKPLLKVDQKPILETIIINFIEYGFREFYVCVNYKAEMIKEHFGDGSRWGGDIHYIHEEKRLGTAGALSLLTDKFSQPIIVMNADLLTRTNFNHLLNFHLENEAKATMCVREYDFQVPYGVVKVDKHELVGIEEKPVHHFFVNAGIYVLDPDMLKNIPHNSFIDMPNYFEKLIQTGFKAVVFPIREYWIDIGHMDDLKKASGDFKQYFPD